MIEKYTRVNSCLTSKMTVTNLIIALDLLPDVQRLGQAVLQISHQILSLAQPSLQCLDLFLELSHSANKLK